MMDAGRGEENKKPEASALYLAEAGTREALLKFMYIHTHVPTSTGKINIDLYFFFWALSIGKFSWLKREVPQGLTAFLDPGLIRFSRTRRTYWDNRLGVKKTGFFPRRERKNVSLCHWPLFQIRP